MEDGPANYADKEGDTQQTVVFWLVNTSSSNNKTNHDLWGNSYIYRKSIYKRETVSSKVKLATIVKGNPKAPFSIATTPRCRGGRYSFPGLLYFTLDPHLIMLSVKQGGIKYHFLSLWYDSTWDWTQVSRAIGEHSNR